MSTSTHSLFVNSLLSFEIKGDRDRTLAVASNLQLITSATSLGGVETLIEHRHSVEPTETCVPENLLRLAIGIEAREDLWSDLEQTLSTVLDSAMVPEPYGQKNTRRIPSDLRYQKFAARIDDHAQKSLSHNQRLLPLKYNRAHSPDCLRIADAH